MPNDDYISDASKDVLEATKKLLGNNPYAIEAIKSRNQRIRYLEDIIFHLKIALKEIEERYDNLSQEKETLEKLGKNMAREYEKLSKLYNTISNEKHKLESKLNEMSNNLYICKELNKRGFSYKVTEYANKVGGFKGAFLRLIFTPPFFNWLLWAIWTLVFIASLVGWTGVWKAIEPIFNIIL